MNIKANKVRVIQLSGTTFCVACMLAAYGVLCGVSHILHQDVFKNYYLLISFITVEALLFVTMIGLLFLPEFPGLVDFGRADVRTRVHCRLAVFQCRPGRVL